MLSRAQLEELRAQLEYARRYLNQKLNNMRDEGFREDDRHYKVVLENLIGNEHMINVVKGLQEELES